MLFSTPNRRLRLLCFLIFLFGVILIWIFYSNDIPNTENFYEVQLPEEELLYSIKPQHRSKLFDIEFHYTLTAEPCIEHDIILAVIIVTSHYQNVETRSAMRRAFSSDDLLLHFKTKRVFLLGEAPQNLYIKQSAINHESERFGDIVQGNFNEAYRNLTYKHIMGLKWASEKCSTAKYVIKMDDDIVFSVNKTISLLTGLNYSGEFIAGYVFRGMKPIREPANKWYVTLQEYHFSNYPSFVSGWLYITTPKVASKLVLLSHYHRYFWIDDVYVTGILAKVLKLKLYDLRKFVAVYSEYMECCLKDLKKSLDCEFLIGPNGGNTNLFYHFNEALKICEQFKCIKRTKSISETCVAEAKLNLKGGSASIEHYRLH